MRFTVANNAYDPAPQAFLFQNQDAAARTVMRLQQVNANATGNILEAVNSTNTVVAKIDFAGSITSNAVAINTPTSPIRLNVLNGDVNFATAKFLKTVPGGDNLTLDNLNSATITNWIKFTTNNEQYVYGAISTDAFALSTKAQFNIQMMPGALGGVPKAGVTIGYNDYTQTPTAKLGVLSGAVDHVGLNIMGRTGATAALQTWGIYSGSGIADAPNNVVVAKVDGMGKFFGTALNLKPTTAPTAPVDGDMWTATDGVYARINGVSYRLTMTAV